MSESDGEARYAWPPSADSRLHRADGEAPLYRQVKRALEERILTGQLRLGDFLPPEPELCRQFAVSTITMRRALMELARDGLIRRKGGVGTVVTAVTKKMKFALLFLGFDDVDWSERAEIFGSLLGGIGDAAWRANADFSTIRIGADEDATPVLKMLADDRDVNGVLLRSAGDIEESCLTLLESRGMPYVVIKRHIEGRPMSFVTRDDVDASGQATEHLIELGHRRIGLILGPRDISPRRAIEEGYRRALERHGLPFDHELVRTTPAGRLPGAAEGLAGMQRLLALEEPPTAVSINGGLMTIGVYDAIARAGLKIPDDIAVLGCGDGVGALAFRPSLTSIATSYEEIGRVAAQTLFHLVARPREAPRQVFVPATLQVRESCGALRAAARVPKSESEEAGIPRRRLVTESGGQDDPLSRECG